MTARHWTAAAWPGVRALGILLAAWLFYACALLEQVPAYQIDLQGTTWTITEIDGRAVTGEPSITFKDGNAAVIGTACRTIDAGWVMDTDGAALGFGDFGPTPDDCTGEASEQERAVIEALKSVDEWRVDDSDHVRFIGGHAVTLERQIAGEDSPAQVEDKVAFDHAVGHLGKRYMWVDGIWLDEHLRDALPNVEFSIDGSPARPAYGGVVEGHVTAAVEGAAYRDEIETDGARSVQLPFDSPDATWRMIVLTIEVENDFDPMTVTPETVGLGVTFDGGADAESMLSAFVGRHVLAVLDRPRAFPPDQTIRIAGRSGALLGFVAEDGSISMPLLGEDEGDYLGGLTTIEAVIAESEKPKSVINVTFSGGYQRGG